MNAASLVLPKRSLLAAPYLNPTWDTEVIWRAPAGDLVRRARALMEFLRHRSMTMVNGLCGGGGSGGDFSAPATIFTSTMAANGAGFENYSFRNVLGSLSGGGSQIRATLTAHSSSTTKFDNISIGKRASNADTTATPVELVNPSGGASGATISGGGTYLTDWGNLAFLSSDTLIGIFDVSGTNGNLRRTTAGTYEHYFKTATDSYNQATVSGFTDNTPDNIFAFSQLEARSLL